MACGVLAGLLALFLGILNADAQLSSSTNDLELIPENESIWKESLLWNKDIVLRAGFGYKDNVLLAPNSREGSAFFASGIDLTIYRLPLDGWEASLSIVGDDVRYFRSPGGLHGEDLLTTSALGQKYFGGVWRSGLELRYNYVDQVLEEFLTAGGAQAVEAKGNTLGIRPFLRRDLSTNWWVQVEAPLGREWWQAPLDSNWKFGGQAVLGFSYGAHSGVTLTGGGFDIPHDQWLARDALGNEIVGRRLTLLREVAELKWDHQWDASNHWSSATRLGFNHTHDNGGGYFDNNRYYISEELRFRTKDWEIKALAGLSYFHFPIQTIGTPPAPLFHLTSVDVSFRLERRIYKALRCFAAFEFEAAASNDPSSVYKDHIESGGLSWEF